MLLLTDTGNALSLSVPCRLISNHSRALCTVQIRIITIYVAHDDCANEFTIDNILIRMRIYATVHNCARYDRLRCVMWTDICGFNVSIEIALRERYVNVVGYVWWPWPSCNIHSSLSVIFHVACASHEPFCVLMAYTAFHISPLRQNYTLAAICRACWKGAYAKTLHTPCSVFFWLFVFLWSKIVYVV